MVGVWLGGPYFQEILPSAPTMVRICRKNPNSDFLGQTGPKKVRIYTEKSEFYHFPLVQRLFNINKLSQQLYKCNK